MRFTNTPGQRTKGRKSKSYKRNEAKLATYEAEKLRKPRVKRNGVEIK